MRTHSISINEVEYAAYRLAVQFMTWDEPIPSFGSRFPNSLESCLKTPFQTYQKKHLYRGLVEKAAILFYLMIKNHPFENGNKRIAIMTLFYFLYKNGKWLNIDNKQLYDIAFNIAKTKPKSRDRAIKWLQTELNNHLINYPDKK
ncbi:MAG: Death-on-curing family protein [Parcubacteria group bacterium GW2011_GWD2_43_10]|nr:MAG: Death-on-curing family protein [Parcubacteria group bacterium GW2011_GWD1_42_9]KKS80849.1 MAG: Death-on-curing family protein [Parcubacteria group bacterium GW2011_GWD2_43_10]